MKRLLSFAIVAVVASTAAVAGCTNGTTDKSSSSVTGSENGGSGPSTTGEKLLYRTSAGWVPHTSPFGETSMVYQTRYDVIVLYETGFAFVGPYDTIDDVVCDAPKKDAKKEDLCVSYRIEGGTIELGGKKMAYEADGGNVTIDGAAWRVVPANDSVVGRHRFNGYYGAQETVSATVKGVTLDLAEDGTFTATRATKTSYAVLSYDFWPKTCENGCRISGRYTVRSRSITFKTSSGASKTLFLRAEGTDVQVGSEWYAPSQ